MEIPKVSVCVLTYNQEAYIAQAVESALSQQTAFAFEIIIGEDRSTDRTREIVVDLANRHPGKIRLCLAAKNQGVGRNFMDIFAQSRGDYVIILDGDDYWTSPHKLQLQADALDAHPEWAMCFHPAVNVYDDGRPSDFYPEEQTKTKYTIYDLLPKDFMATTAVMFRNRLFERLPDWFADVVVGDWTLHLLNAVHGNIGFLPEPMSVYRIHDGGMFSKKSLQYKLTTIFKMWTNVDHHFGGKYTAEIDENRLQAVRWIAGQLEHESQVSKHHLGRVSQLASRITELEANIHLFDSHHDLIPDTHTAAEQLQLTIEGLKADSVQLKVILRQREQECADVAVRKNQLETEHARLQSELQSLRSFHDIWHGSLLYRAYRETVRPWRRLRRRLSNSPVRQ